LEYFKNKNKRKVGDEMARPQKQGLEYFPLDVSMSDKVELIEAEYGIEGFAVLIKMFQKIYSQGYFYEWDEKHILLFSSRVSVESNKVLNIVHDCIKWGIFSKEMYEKHNILTSRRIQEQYISAAYKRAKVEMLEYLLLIDVSNKNNVILLTVSDNGNEDTTIVSDIQSTQSKVKKSKVKESNNYIVFLKAYTDQNIINHKDLTHKIKGAIDKALNKDKEENILKAIERYGQAFNDRDYVFCTYKMTLEKFLTQNNGYTDWLDVGQKWFNYNDFKNKPKNNTNQVKSLTPKKKTGFHLANSRGDKYSAEELEALILGNQKRKMQQIGGCI